LLRKKVLPGLKWVKNYGMAPKLIYFSIEEIFKKVRNQVLKNWREEFVKRVHNEEGGSYYAARNRGKRERK
jgi:hypothetical protein